MPFTKKPEQLEREDLVVGIPLEFDIYSGTTNHLLLSRNETIRNEKSLESILRNRPYTVLNEKEFYVDYGKKQQPFDGIEYLAHRVRYLLRKHTNNNTDDFEDKLLLIAEEILLYTYHYPDQSIALLQLWASDDYATFHPIHCALLAAIIAQSQEWQDMKIIQLIAAAITMNISITMLQEDLFGRRTTIQDDEKIIIENHPEKSVDILEACGVTREKYPTLIRAILQHHESVDGHGYPMQLQGSEICDAALILNICDRYCAMTSERISRHPMGSAKAIRGIYELFQDEEHDMRHKTFAHQLVRELGLYPPGTLVKLSDSSIALVLQRDAEKVDGRPVVAQLRSPGNLAYARPSPLNLRKSKVKIDQVLNEKATLDMRVRNLFLQSGFDPIFLG